jgi:hypothetical protein
MNVRAQVQIKTRSQDAVELKLTAGAGFAYDPTPLEIGPVGFGSSLAPAANSTSHLF